MLSFIIACNKDETDKFEIENNNNNNNASVEIETKDVDHLKHAVFTTLEDGKLVVLFSQIDLHEIYDSKINSSLEKKSINIPNQIFYLGIYPATEGVFPDLSKLQIGAINYNKIILDTDLSISLSASQKYMATHIIVNATTAPIELGVYNIAVDEYNDGNYITGEFDGTLIKIDLETEKPDLTSPPITVKGNFDKAKYIDYEKVKDLMPIDIDISSLLK